MVQEKAAVVGLGYVGIPLAALLADRGLDVLGIDVVPERVEHVNEGRLPLKGVEPGLPEMLRRIVKKGFLSATTSFEECSDRRTIFVCVDTPIDREKRPDNSRLVGAIKAIGENMRRGTMIVVESTVAPGTMLATVAPALEATSGLRLGKDFKLAHCPERVMPGKLLHNLTTYDRVIGALDATTAKRAVSIYSRITKGKLHTTDLTTAEIVKTTENAYRDVQIAFANEISLICERLGVDSFEVRRLVNTCPFRDMHVPGAGVGGHCLPKDPWLLAYGGREIQPVLIPTARMINDGMPSHVAELAVDALRELKVKKSSAKITILGGSFLQNSGDARNSPTISLVECLKGVRRVCIHDPYLEELEGMNVERNLAEALKDADLAIFMVAHEEYAKLTPSALKKAMKRPAIVDGRNIFSQKKMVGSGFVYRGVGKSII